MTNQHVQSVKWKAQVVPCRTAYALSTTIATSAWVRPWKRVYRQVFWLSDGRRDNQYIAQLLHKSEARIKRIVDALTVSGYLKKTSKYFCFYKICKV